MLNYLFDEVFLFGLLMAYLAFAVPVFVVFIAAFWRLFSKAGQPGWAVLIPFYNLYIYTQIIKRPRWWMLLYLLCAIPFIGAFGLLLLSIIDALRLAKVFGRSTEFGIGLILVNIVFVSILAFGKSDYDSFRVTEGDLI
jgi:hypothetical protein